MNNIADGDDNCEWAVWAVFMFLGETRRFIRHLPSTNFSFHCLDIPELIDRYSPCHFLFSQVLG